MNGLPKYRAYLLRLWRTQGAGGPGWRASLEDSHTGERRVFATLAQLAQFLEEETGGLSQMHPPSDPANHKPEGG